MSNLISRRDYRLLSFFVIGTIMLLASCGVISEYVGGDCMDRSEPIYLQAESAPALGSAGDLTAEEFAAVTTTLGPSPFNRHITVGYVYQPSWDDKPWHNSDFAAYWSSAEANGYGTSDPVVITGDQAVFEDYRSTTTPNAIELHCRAEFSRAAVQDALDQQYSHKNRFRFYHVAVDNRLRVPVHWQVTGTVNGKDFATEYDEQMYVTRQSEGQLKARTPVSRDGSS